VISHQPSLPRRLCQISYLCQLHSIWIYGRHSCVPRSERGVPHKSIQRCPYRAENLRGWSQWWLLQRHVRTLGIFGYQSRGIVSKLIVPYEQSNIRRTTRPMLAPRAMGSRIDEYGLANTCPGRVIDGMKLVMALGGGSKLS